MTLLAWRTTSWMAMMVTRVVSLLSVISCETVAGTIRRRPWGRTTNRICWRVGEPERRRRLVLAPVERLDARAHDLAEDRGVVEDQGEQGAEHELVLERLRKKIGDVSA